MLILKVLKMSLKQRKIKSRIEEYLNSPYQTSIPYYSSLSIVSACAYDQSTETQAFEGKKNLEAKERMYLSSPLPIRVSYPQ